MKLEISEVLISKIYSTLKNCIAIEVYDEQDEELICETWTLESVVVQLNVDVHV